jgi:hypothetical protein
MSHITSCKVIGHIGDQISEHTAHINLGYCKAQSLTTNLAPKKGQAAWPCRLLFPVVGSAGRTAQIVRAPVFLQKNLER